MAASARREEAKSGLAMGRSGQRCLALVKVNGEERWRAGEMLMRCRMPWVGGALL
jgi:hypothetical protein